MPLRAASIPSANCTLRYIILPSRYSIGIDQKGQSIQDTTLALLSGTGATGQRGGQRLASNVTINDVLFRRVRATLGKRTSKFHHEMSYGSGMGKDW